MTEKEMKEKAEKHLKEIAKKKIPFTCRNVNEQIKKTYIDGIKLGLKQHSHDYLVKTINLKKKYEKQIQIDAEQVRALQKQNGELTDRVKELEGDLELYEGGACRKTNLDKCDVVKELKAQIEKMKNCRNCKKEKIEGACGHFTQVGWCKNWELAE